MKSINRKIIKQILFKETFRICCIFVGEVSFIYMKLVKIYMILDKNSNLSSLGLSPFP